MTHQSIKDLNIIVRGFLPCKPFSEFGWSVVKTAEGEILFNIPWKGSDHLRPVPTEKIHDIEWNPWPLN
jgi:hypothetical protein